MDMNFRNVLKSRFCQKVNNRLIYCFPKVIAKALEIMSKIELLKLSSQNLLMDALLFLIIISTLVGTKYQMKLFKNKGLRTGSSLSFPQAFELKEKNIRLSSISLKCELPQKRLYTSSPFKQTKINLPNKTPLCQPHNKLVISDKRPSLPVKPQKHSLRIQKSMKNSFRITQCSENTTSVSSDVQKMVKILENNYVLTQKQSNLYLIKKEDLSKLLQNCFQFKMATKKEQFLENSQEFTNILKRIWETIDQLRIRNKHNLLKITNNVYEKYTNREYYGEVQKETSKLRAVQAERLENQAELRDIQRHFKDVRDRKDAMHKLICEHQRKIYELQHQYEENIRLNNDLQNCIERRQSQMDKLNADYKEIEEFVTKQDKNKILKLVSEDYKSIEGEIYDYAAFLQSNQLASDISYQHIPIVCHTFGLEEQISSINKVLVQNDQVPLKEKGRILRDFLVEIVQKYRKKDIQIQKLFAFKTKCIVTFIDKMKKWLGNWELKQEYLKNLRMEHIHYHTIIEEFLMKDNIHCDKCKGQIKNEKSQILKIYQKLQENFKMGNSFY